MVKIEPVTKNHPNRERKKVILVGTEGKNKTEELYLRELEGTQKKYHFIFAAGNETDPSNPCFEIWYLEHLGYSSKVFRNSEEVIKQILKKML